MLHGGDSDSTGIIAAACWGAMEGYTGVPENQYKNLEYRDRLASLGKKIHQKVCKCHNRQRNIKTVYSYKDSF